MMLIETTKGLMEADELEKRVGGHDNDAETLSWVEYRHKGELVHRSVSLYLKTGIFADAVAADFGG